MVRLFTLFESVVMSGIFHEEMVNDKLAVQVTEKEKNKVSYYSTAPNNLGFTACALLSWSTETERLRFSHSYSRCYCPLSDYRGFFFFFT